MRIPLAGSNKEFVPEATLTKPPPAAKKKTPSVPVPKQGKGKEGASSRRFVRRVRELGLCRLLVVHHELQAAAAQQITHAGAAAAVLVNDILTIGQVGIGQDLAHAHVEVDALAADRVPVQAAGREGAGLAAEHERSRPRVHHASGILEHDALLGLGITFLEREDIQEEHVVLPDLEVGILARVRVLDVHGAHTDLDPASDDQGVIALGAAQVHADAAAAVAQAHVMVLADGGVGHGRVLRTLGDLDDAGAQVLGVEQFLDRGVVALVSGRLLDGGDVTHAVGLDVHRSQLGEEVLPVRKNVQSSDRSDGHVGHHSLHWLTRPSRGGVQDFRFKNGSDAAVRRRKIPQNGTFVNLWSQKTHKNGCFLWIRPWGNLFVYKKNTLCIIRFEAFISINP